MKKITLLFSFMIFSYGFSQTVLSEDFEAGTSLPTGWTNNDIAGNGEVWTFEDTGEAVLLSDGNQVIYDLSSSGIYAAFDSDAYGDNDTEENAALESPVFDCSALTSVILSFTHAFAGIFGGSGFVEVLDGDDASNTWQTIAAFTEDGYIGGSVEFDVSNELAGVTNAQIRFRWTGDWSAAWYFDNVEVFECTESTPEAVSVPFPADNAVNVSLAQDTDYTDDGIINADDAAITFTWDNSADNIVSNYIFKLGASNPPTQEFTANSNDGFTIFGLETDTQYFWSVTANNCAGASPEMIYNFTTESTLSNTDFEVKKVLEHFVSNNTLTINANYNIEQIEIYNMLGKLVHTAQPDKDDVEINLSLLSKGMYIAKVGLGANYQTFKFVK